MSIFYREKSTFICPRCGIKCISGTQECPDCGLVFSRLEIATNKDAKRKILRRDKDFIIYTNKLPSDVKYYKLLLMTIFLGICGAHCFYVGRYWRGGLLLFNFIFLLCCVIFNNYLVDLGDGRVIAAMATIGGLIMLVWVYDLAVVTMKKFKVPIAIDLESQVIPEIEVEK